MHLDEALVAVFIGIGAGADWHILLAQRGVADAQPCDGSAGGVGGRRERRTSRIADIGGGARDRTCGVAVGDAVVHRPAVLAERGVDAGTLAPYFIGVDDERVALE